MSAYLSEGLKLALAKEQLTPFGHALAGALGGVFSNAVVYPLDTVKTRIQGSDESVPQAELPDALKAAQSQTKGKAKAKGILPILFKIWKKDGLGGFYNGFLANMLNTFSMQFAYFYFHTFLRALTLRRLTRRAGKPITQLSTSLELLLGALAGAFAQVFTIPVAVIATRQQLYEAPAAGQGKKQAARPPTFFETAHEIIDEDGIAGLWTGLKPGLVLTVNPAITYGVFERVKGVVLAAKSGDGRLTPGTAFLLGVLSKTLATVVTYPYIFAKVRLQAKQSAVPAGSPTSPRAATPTAPGAPVTVAPSSTDVSTPELHAAAAATAPHVQETPEQKEHAQHHFASAEDLQANAVAATRKARYTVFGKNRSRVKTASAVDILRATLEKEGVLGWYKGMQAQILKAVLSQGILFMAKSQFETYALLLILVFKRLVQRKASI